MRDGRDVFDRHDLESCQIQRAYGGFSASTRAFDPNFDAAQSQFHRFLCGFRGCQLSGKRSVFPGAFETGGSRRCPRDHISEIIRERNDCIIKGRLDGRYTFGVHPNFFLLLRCGTFLWQFRYLLYYPFLPTFVFFLLTVRLGPLAVRALVFVRCPLTGNPRLCLRPR